MTFCKTVCVLALALLSGSLWSAEADALKEKPEEGTNAVPTAAEEPADPKFERYKTIMDRMPFGPEPVNFNPDAPGTAGTGGGGAGGAADPAAEEAAKSQQEQQILASVRVSALNVTPSGKVAVGFTDSSKQPAGTYYLKVGESRDGWTVKSADAREMKVTLEKDGVEATLALGEGAGGGKGGKSGGAPGGQAQTRNRLGRQNRAGLLSPAPSAPVGGGGGSAFANLRARRAQKEAERRAEVERQAAAAAQAKADQEQAAAERERAAAEREQQRETLQQIQEELRRQREAKEQQRNEDAAMEAQPTEAAVE